jgi:hypothetical protein
VADTQLARLAKEFPRAVIHTNPSGGGQYVKHSVVAEKLLAVLGVYSWEKVEVVRGYVAAIPPNPQGSSKRAREGRPALENAVVGYIGRLTCRVDGQVVSVEGTGDCEDPHNWPHDGARLKDADSDAFKRAAKHVAVGLHLWSQDEFTLYKQLMNQPPKEAA